MNKPQNIFTWNPNQDTLWICETGYIDSLEKEKKTFIKVFKEYFDDQNDEFEGDINDLNFFPLGFWKGEMIYLANDMLDSFDLSEMDKSNITEKLNELADKAVKTCPEKLYGAIIFKVRSLRFWDLIDLEKCLKEVDYCAICGLDLMVHYQPTRSVEQVTLFKYETECG